MNVYTKIVPDEFDVPLLVYGNGFILQPLSPKYANIDYEAVMESRPILKDIFSDDWPDDIKSWEDNLRYIEEDYSDFQQRIGFSYIILDPSESRCLGCVYIFPSLFEGYDVAIYYWLHINILNSALAYEIETFIRKWVQEHWCIPHPAYPGRDIPWPEWLQRERKTFAGTIANSTDVSK
ncbi:N-acetyltransferase [Photorhabdus bodei]|uniref:N-acetyltransferase n=1 Tax=Photorhabdus bodei TaxID=2029681 RepID=A0AAW6BFJ4_9GAMM|nr:N-acetyltransferase [Photorhabdus bodei]MDB6372223.1 N-acetyltransferase [Photorhabdus bodei]